MENKERAKNQLIYGIHAVQEAIDAKREFERIYILKDGKSEGIRELTSDIKNLKLPVHHVPIHKLTRLTRGNHQGVVAFLNIVPNIQLSEIIMGAFERGEVPKLLVLDNITDVRNFGAISRSAVAFGYHGIVIPFKGSALIHADAVKASAGALMKIAVSRVSSLRSALMEIKNSGLEVVSITEKGTTAIAGFKESTPHALILGSEEKGIDRQLVELSTVSYRIPISDQIDSLNVSVAAAIAMFKLSE
jgi:23S rRNA (guanosine2251-2'-O)-methyltransferase